MIVEVQCLWRFNACGGSMLVEGGLMLVEAQCLWRLNACGG